MKLPKSVLLHLHNKPAWIRNGIAKRLKELETENTRLKKLLAETMLENEIAKEALRKKW